MTLEVGFGCFPKLWYLFGGPNNKDYSILGCILGFPYLEKLPFRVHALRFKV